MDEGNGLQNHFVYLIYIIVGSNPALPAILNLDVTEWLGGSLQNCLHEFESHLRVYIG